VHKLTMPVSVSHAHSLANVRQTPDDMVAVLRQVTALRDERFPGVGIEAGYRPPLAARCKARSLKTR
jgi:hydroxymethylglutaryl-CoA lyase